MTELTELEEQEKALVSRFQSAFHNRAAVPVAGKVKRAFDLIGAAAGLVILAVPFLAIAIAIKIDSPGSVFFVRARVGRGGRFFPLIKFRTMDQDALNQGTGYSVSRDDPRITRVGRLLRLWSIDEFPQLLNVLRGDMSLVGPRPSWPHEVMALDDAQLGKVRVRPGITGLAAVKGRNHVPWDKRVAMDNWYIDHWSMVLDLKILALTPVKVVTREGIYGMAGVNPSITRHPEPRRKADSNLDATREGDRA